MTNKENSENGPVDVHSLSHDGRGIATVNQKTTFIAGALPGESVTFRILKKRKTYHDAEVVSVLRTAETRETPPCEHFGVCGGCSLQHMKMDTQIALKQKTLLDQLTHFGRVTPEAILPPLTAATTGYRRKGRLGSKFVIKKDKMLVGFREKASKYLADLSRCAVLHPSVGERLTELAALLRSLTAYQSIPQIEIAIGDETVALIFRHLEPLTLDDRTAIISFGEKYHFHIYLQPNPPAKVEKIFPADGIDRMTYTLPDEGLTYSFHPLDFTQINLEMNRLMVKQALDLLDVQPNETVLDLYSGIGNFTLPIAKRAKEVIGVEGGEEMVSRASDNAKLNHIENASFYAANLETPPLSAPWMKKRYDKILLDPPRVGAKEMLSHLANFKAKKIVYVSCNPATLARDAGELVNQYGYRLKCAGIMNMFPHTSHIEAIALFEKD